MNGAGGNDPRATTTPDARFFDVPLEAWQAVTHLNLLGTILPSQVFARPMAERKEGVVLNVSSVNASRPLTRIAAYSASKAGISNFTQWLAVHLAQEYAPAIRVNAVMPGFFLTEQNRFLLTDRATGALTARGQKILDHTPMARFGVPDDLTGAVPVAAVAGRAVRDRHRRPGRRRVHRLFGRVTMTGRGGKGLKLDEAAVRALCAQEVARWSLRGKRVLAIVPDNTRTAPIDLMFRVLHEEARAAGRGGLRRADRAGHAPAHARRGHQPAAGADAAGSGRQVRADAHLQPPLERSGGAGLDRRPSRKTRSPRSRAGACASAWTSRSTAWR